MLKKVFYNVIIIKVNDMKRILFFILLLLININVLANDDLQELKVNGQEVKCAGYECEVEIDSNSAEITYKQGENVKSVNPESGYKTNIDSNYSMKMVVTYQDDTTANYTLKITKHIASSDNSLKKLMIDEEEIELKKDIFVYSYETKFDAEKVVIKGTTNDKNAKCEEKEIEFALERSSLSIEYSVTAENGDVKKYTIILKRKSKPDTTLKTLTLSDVELDFKSNRFDYEVTIPYGVDSTEIKAIPNNSKAIVSVAMEEFFKVGENFVKITVTNEEASDTYVVKINRLEKVDENIANLESLEIEGYDLKFNSNIYEYDLYFDEIPDKLNINYKKVSEDAVVKISDNENLEDGSIIFIRVSLDNGLVKIYNLKVNLKNVVVNNNEVNELLVIIVIIILVVVMIILLILQINEKNKKKKKSKTKKNVKKIMEEEIEVI